jgi:glutamyl-tRNA synthetase
VILDGMKWLGLNPDEGPFFQTQRMDRYREVIDQMLLAGTAYRCYCTTEELDALRAEQTARKEKPRYDGRWRERTDSRPGVNPVIRFKNPLAGEVVVEDVIHGRVVFDNKELDDLVIARGDGTPTYNFCVVVDDMDMDITHVIRGDDHLNNTPRQINMLRALGATPPSYAHLPMILGPDGAKLSKRHGAVSVLQYQEEGFLPEALLNYLARLGWSHGDQEVFSLAEMAQLFDIADVNKSAAAINPDKLLWLNQQHMMHAPLPRLAQDLQWQLQRLGVICNDLTLLEGVVAAQRERAKTLEEMARASMYFFQDVTEYDEKAARKNLTTEAKPLLSAVREQLAALGEWNAPAIHGVLEAVCAQAGVGLGKVAQPLRVAISGSSISPPIDATLALLGRDTVLKRIDQAVQRIAFIVAALLTPR